MQGVVIAAGHSSRFWPLNHQRHKSQIQLLGRSVLYWTLKGFRENGITDVVVVVGKESTIPEMAEQENDLGLRLRFAVQEEPLGTGNALWQAKEYLTEPFVVAWPNKVNSREIIARMQELKRQGAELVLAGAATETPWDYGVFRIEFDEIKEIVENPREGEEPSRIKFLGMFLLEPDFFEVYEALPRHHESDLVEALNRYLERRKAQVVILKDNVPALKYPWEVFVLQDILFASPYFTEGIAASAKIGPNVIINGPVVIGENTVVHDNTVIEGPCYIGPDSSIGTGNLLRGPVNLERGLVTGALCEIKHSVVQEDTHFHSGYVGDSIIGRHCRVGSGFITANRRLDRKNIKVAVQQKRVDTGSTFFGAIIGDNTAIGIHVGTMPGACIGNNCLIGPSVHVFGNMDDNTELLAKQQQDYQKRAG